MAPDPDLSMQYNSHRRQTFDDGVFLGRAKNPKKWPHGEALKQHLADRGFFFAPSFKYPDLVTCFGCGKKEHDLGDTNEISHTHLANNPKCALALIASAFCNYSDSLNAASFWPSQKLLLLNDPLGLRSIEMRRSTFKNLWPYENDRPATKSTSRNLAAAGFYYAPLHPENDRVICMYCEYALENWDPEDDPLIEHRHSDKGYCYLLDKLDNPDKHYPVASELSDDLVELATGLGEDFDFYETEGDLSSEKSPRLSALPRETTDEEKISDNAVSPSPSKNSHKSTRSSSSQKDVFDFSLDNISDPDHASFFAKKNPKKYVSKRKVGRVRQPMVKEKASAFFDSDDESTLVPSAKNSTTVSLIETPNDDSAIKRVTRSRSRRKMTSNGDEKIDTNAVEPSQIANNSVPEGAGAASVDSEAKNNAEVDSTPTFDGSEPTIASVPEDDLSSFVMSAPSPSSRPIRKTRSTRSGPISYDLESSIDFNDSFSDDDTDITIAENHTKKKAKVPSKRKKATQEEVKIPEGLPPTTKKRRIRLKNPPRSPGPDLFDLSNQNLGDYGEGNINFIEDDISRVKPIASPTTKKETPPIPTPSSKSKKTFSIKKPLPKAKAVPERKRTTKSRSIFDVSSEDVIFGGRQDLSFDVTQAKIKGVDKTEVQKSQSPSVYTEIHSTQDVPSKKQAVATDVLAEIASTDTPPPALPIDKSGVIDDIGPVTAPILEQSKQDITEEPTSLSKPRRKGRIPKAKNENTQNESITKNTRSSVQPKPTKKVSSDPVGSTEILNDSAHVIEEPELDFEKKLETRKSGSRRKKEASLKLAEPSGISLVESNLPLESGNDEMDTTINSAKPQLKKTRKKKELAPVPASTETLSKRTTRKRKLKVFEEQGSNDSNLDVQPQKAGTKRRQLKKDISWVSEPDNNVLVGADQKEVESEHFVTGKLELHTSKVGFAFDEESQDVSELSDKSLVTRKHAESEKEVYEVSASRDNPSKSPSVGIEIHLKSGSDDPDIGAVSAAVETHIEPSSPRNDVPKVSSSEQDLSWNQPQENESSKGAHEEKESSEHSPMPDFLPSNISGSTDIDLAVVNASFDPLSAPKHAPNDSNEEEEVHGDTYQSNGTENQDHPSNGQLGNDTFLSDEESPRKDISLSPSSYAYYKQDLAAIKGEIVDITTTTTTTTTKRATPIGEEEVAHKDNDESESAGINEKESEAGNNGDKSEVEESTTRDQIRLGETLENHKVFSKKASVADTTFKETFELNDVRHDSEGGVNLSLSGPKINAPKDIPYDNLSAKASISDGISAKETSVGEYVPKEAGSKERVVGEIIAQEAIFKSAITDDSMSKEATPREAIARGIIASENIKNDGNKATSENSFHGPNSGVQTACSLPHENRAISPKKAGPSTLINPQISEGGAGHPTPQKWSVSGSPTNRLGRLSGDVSNALGSSTPQGNQFFVNADLDWEPLRQFQEELKVMDGAIKYLHELGASDVELYNDVDGELTRFISQLPEEEAKMTIEEWVLHNGASCGKTVREFCERMIVAYEEECDRVEAAVMAMSEVESDEEHEKEAV